MLSFLDLPAELRVRVYHHLWDGDHIFMPQIFAGDPKRPASLLQVCREIRDETSPIWYRGTHIKFSFDPAVRLHDAIRWLDGLGDKNVREVRNMTLWYQCGTVYELTVTLSTTPPKVTFATWTRTHVDEKRGETRRSIKRIIRENRSSSKGMDVDGWKEIVLYLDRVLQDQREAMSRWRAERN